MTPKIATATDPIFLCVLDLLERIKRNKASAPEDEANRILNFFRDADAQIGDIQGWDLAKFAITAWIDDVLIEAPWDGRRWWQENSLEFRFFRTQDRATEFYQRSKQAAALSRRDFLEIFYICVVLGFQGLYALSESAFLANELQLPPTIQEWARMTARSIQVGRGRAGFVDSIRPCPGAPPLEGRFELLNTVLAFMILLAFVIVLAFFTLVSPDKKKSGATSQVSPSQPAFVVTSRQLPTLEVSR